MSTESERMTVPKFIARKAAGQRITMLTAYDYLSARILDAAGIEAVLVGDSVANVVQGHANTLPVTLDQMIYHAEIVGRAVENALVVVDMPFPFCFLGPGEALRAAARILKETRCRAVKLEGGADQAATIAALVSAGIPVMAHCGLRPQNVHQLGRLRVQRDRDQLLTDAQAAEAAGAFAVLLECIPAEMATEITAALRVPTIGIGAGAGCDGQVLVLHDMLGLTPGRALRHVKAYANLAGQIAAAVAQFRDEVRNGEFPGKQQSFE